MCVCGEGGGAKSLPYIVPQGIGRGLKYFYLAKGQNYHFLGNWSINYGFEKFVIDFCFETLAETRPVDKLAGKQNENATTSHSNVLQECTSGMSELLLFTASNCSS